MPRQKSFKIKRKEPRGDVAWMPTGSAYLMEGAGKGIDDFEKKARIEEKIFEQEGREEEAEEEAFFEETDEGEDDDLFELIAPTEKPAKPETYRLPSQEYEDILVGVAEKGTWFEAPKTFWKGMSFKRLVDAGYIIVDEEGRPSITEKGKKYLATWKISYTKQPAPAFKEPKIEEEAEEIIEEAGGEFREPTEIEREPTAEELVR
jgi:hypothetical protein